MNIETIKSGDKILAIIVKTVAVEEGLKFISPEHFPLQVGIHNRKIGELVEAHEHVPFENIEKLEVQEILYADKGEIEVGLYDNNKKVAVRNLVKGDLIILNSGHYVKFLEDSKVIEIKQGPYRGKENEKKYLTDIEEKDEEKNDSSM